MRVYNEGASTVSTNILRGWIDQFLRVIGDKRRYATPAASYPRVISLPFELTPHHIFILPSRGTSPVLFSLHTKSACKSSLGASYCPSSPSFSSSRPSDSRMASRRLPTYGVAAALTLGILWLLSYSFSSLGSSDYTGIGRSHFNQAQAEFEASHPPTTPHDPAPALRRRNITFASSFVYHGDVYMTLAKSMGDIFDAEDVPGQINVFAQPFPFGFEEVVEDLHLWTHRGVRAQHDDFIPFLNAETGDGGVDLIILGTCQYECVCGLHLPVPAAATTIAGTGRPSPAMSSLCMMLITTRAASRSGMMR